MPRALGTFETTWDEHVYDDAEGARLLRATVDKVFHGDLEGTGTVQVLRAVSQVATSAGYVAIERVSGTLHGRSGTFVLQHNGSMADGEMALTVSVVPDSGTGGLRTLAGRMEITMDEGKHTFDFDYSLGE